ncbi:MAG: hypothetical protein ACOZBX_03325, partial [Campylobacterota bacterium]
MSITPLSKFSFPILFCGTLLSAESFSTVEYVKVTRSSPVYATIQEEIPEERCYDVQEAVETGGGMNNVVGAVAGGALGG